MLDQTALATRIAAQAPAFKLVDEFAGLVAAKGVARAVPAAFIFPSAETAPEPDNYAGLQRLRVDFGVLIVVRNVADAGGGAAQAEAKDLSDALRAALRGWSPGANYSRIRLASAGPAEMSNGYLYWPENFSTSIELD